jgi:DNA-binding transcriptional LysR family regulator
VTAEDLVTTELACVVPKAHALARKRVVKPADLVSEAVISLGAATRIGLVVEEECRKAGMPAPDVHIEASSSLAACLMVSEGAGIGLVDGGLSLSSRFADLAFRPFAPRIALEVKLIYSRDRPRSRAAALLSDVLRASLKRT